MTHSVTRKLIDISSNSMLDGTAYLSPVMSMSVAKPINSKRNKRSSDSFDEFDLMEKRQVIYYDSSPFNDSPDDSSPTHLFSRVVNRKQNRTSTVPQNRT